MNALEIIERVREHQAELHLDHDRLLVRGRGGPLPEDLQRALREHKAELMVALGAPVDQTVMSVLKALRPKLPPILQGLPDSSLLALVNWALIAAWEKTIRDARFKQEAER